jgi:hypothetical protein
MEVLLLKPERLANAALDAVSIRSPRGVLACDQHAQPRAAAIPPPQIKSEAVDGAPLALPQQLLEIGLLPQPARRA